jgi:hypothetical protein
MKFREAQKRAVELFESDAFLERIKEEDSTMLKHLPLLQKINKSGFLTIESQAGNHMKGISKVDGKPYELLERAYITGFMLEKEAIEFIKNMGIYTDKNAVYVPICDPTPSSLDIPLTITKKKEIIVETHMSPAIPKETDEFFKKMVHLHKTEKVVFIFCWDPVWCRVASGKRGLFTEVYGILKST